MSPKGLGGIVAARSPNSGSWKGQKAAVAPVQGDCGLSGRFGGSGGRQEMFYKKRTLRALERDKKIPVLATCSYPRDDKVLESTSALLYMDKYF